MSRLLSAWNQKFDVGYDGVDQYLKYAAKIQQEFENPDYKPTSAGNETHLVSLAAFLDYVAFVANNEMYNEHWKRYNYFSYLVITYNLYC